MIITRFFNPPPRTFILLGPRGTGKSTLLSQKMVFDKEFDLLQSKHFLPLSANPSLLQTWVQDLKPHSWVFIDEIQKIPLLMDEVHSLYEKRKLNFALSGSSARKLKRGAANLLAGRALSFQLFPFTFSEYKSIYSIKEATEWGSLPKVVTDKEWKVDFLNSYVETYLRQELMEEGLIRKLEPFHRFLQTAGQFHGQILNIENIARESHNKRTTVDKYFEILEDTLLGFRLPSLQIKLNKKEVTHPKFYLFDSGVARACAGFMDEPIDSQWLGFAFESLIINEVRAFNHYLKKNRSLFYYKFNDGYEIDLVIEKSRKSISTPAKYLAIEIKLSKRWDKRWNESLYNFQTRSKGRVTELIGVYNGSEIIEFQNNLKILPAEIFLTLLSEGKII